MIDSQSILEERAALSEDLRECVDVRTLVRLVFEALHAIEQEEAQVSAAKPLPPGRPRVSLSVLTFSYATGLYSSDEIERQMVTDPDLRYLSANVAPAAADLRHCRRYHRALLQRTLSRLLRLTWQAQQPHGDVVEIGSSPALEQVFDGAAQVRIEQAVMADTMALDT